MDLELENTGAIPFEAEARIILKGQPSFKQALGEIKSGKETKSTLVPDIARPTEATIEISKKGASNVLVSTTSPCIRRRSGKFTMWLIPTTTSDMPITFI